MSRRSSQTRTKKRRKKHIKRPPLKQPSISMAEIDWVHGIAVSNRITSITTTGIVSILALNRHWWESGPKWLIAGSLSLFIVTLLLKMHLGQKAYFALDHFIADANAEGQDPKHLVVLRDW